MANKNKITIYLIKKEHSKDEDFLKGFRSLKNQDINGVGAFYYDNSNISHPSWIDKFFTGEIDDVKSKIKTTGAKAILIIRESDRIFAVPFGYGWRCLNDGVFEERFGLKVALSSMSDKAIKKITKRNVAITPKSNQEQLAQFGDFYNFSFDTEQDLIEDITGASTEEVFGKNITGKDSVSFTAKVNITNIKDVCKKCLDKYKSDEYKERFGWIDNIQAIKNKSEIQKLDNDLIKQINDEKFDKVWMAIPDIIDWSDVNFSYTKRQNRDEKDDINLQDFLEFYNNEISLDILKNRKIYTFSETNHNCINDWAAYKCLYCEINKNNKTFLLNDGKWYEIKADFVQKVNDFYNTEIQNQSNTNLIDAEKNENEKEYNQRLSDDIDALNLDGKNIMIGGGHSKIEFCDILTKNKELIHVKKYGNSTVLGHLLNQGLVSAQTFLNDKNFIGKANKKIDNEYSLPKNQDEIIKYKIIFAIISKYDQLLNIPFFSKVVMKHILTTLRNFGFNAKIKQINTLPE